MVERQEEYGWEFIFLGGNIDAVIICYRFSIDQDRAVATMRMVGTCLIMRCSETVELCGPIVRFQRTGRADRGGLQSVEKNIGGSVINLKRV